MVATVIAGDKQRDGAAIQERALRGVGALTALGIGEGDVVAIMLRNEPAFLEAMLIARHRRLLLLPDQLALQGRRGRLHPARLSAPRR